MRRLATFLATTTGRVVRYVISIALLGFLAAQIDWAELTAARTQLSLPLIVAALVLVGLTFPIQAARWWLLLRAQQIPLSFHWSHVVTWIGQFYNAFLLGGIGGDAGDVGCAAIDHADCSAHWPTCHAVVSNGQGQV
jgi:uncharacterized membrane protein YbhN (UPF0104 family)